MKYLILALVIIHAMALDYNTYSNYQDVKIDHLDFNWILHLDVQRIAASVHYQFTFLKSGISEAFIKIISYSFRFI